MDQPTGGWTGLFYQFYRGPFWSAASLAEYLQLLYLNNMPLGGVAPGLDAAQLGSLMLLHQSELDVTEDQIATQSFGSDLLAHVLATIQQLLLGRSIPGLASRRGDRLVYYAGHDLNLYVEVRVRVRPNRNPNPNPNPNLKPSQVLSAQLPPAQLAHPQLEHERGDARRHAPLRAPNPNPKPNPNPNPNPYPQP